MNGKGSLKGWAGLATVSALMLGLIFAANLLTVLYISSERYVYYWDYAVYWQSFGRLAELLRTDVWQAFAAISYSLKFEEYTLLPVLPLAPFRWLMGEGRQPYILAITNIALIPSAGSLALLNERIQGQWNWLRFVISTAAILGIHILWAPALRGYPDAIGLVVAGWILLMYFGKAPFDQRSLRPVWLGALLCLLILTRRWYIFWAVSFFPAALLAQLFAREDRKKVFATGLNLLFAGMICLIILAIVAAPMLVRIATRNYPAAYLAYRSDDGVIEQIVGQFGLVLIAIAGTGLGWLASHKRTRRFGVFLIAQAIIAVGLFTRVQTLLGPQHYYLLMPACGLGVAAAISLVWKLPLNRPWRALGVTGLCAVILLSSAVALSSSHVVAASLLPTARFRPLVRNDLGEIHRLLDTLAHLTPGPIYVASSSAMLNWSILKVACEEEQLTFCPQIGSIQEVDLRDGFPRDILDARYVVLSTPTQYHLRPNDQQTVGLIASDVREHRELGAAFEHLAGGFTLDQGVQVAIYRRIGSIRAEDVRALSQALQRAYPAQKSLFEVPSH